MRKILYTISIAIFISCSGENPANNETEVTAEVFKNNETIELTQEQIELSGIKTGKIIKQSITESIECSGVLEVPPQNIATVSPVINGFINTLNYYPGESVQKGTVLASLNHPDFIKLQQQYIEAKSQYDYYQEEYKRQGELTVENAASIKKMQQAKADFLKNEANYKSLKAQLELLGVNTMTIEKGDFEKEFKLISPINGIISTLNTNKGKFVNTDETIYEIMNTASLNVNLKVFEKDFSKVKQDQKITFKILNSDKLYESYVKRTGVKIDPSNRTVLVQGTFENKNFELNPGMYLKAFVHINKRHAYVLPSDAVTNSNGSSFIFMAQNNSFRRVKIDSGTEQMGFIEIKDMNDKLLNAEIVVKGAYYLMAEFGEE